MPFEPSVKVPIHPDETVETQYLIDLHFLEEYKDKRLLSYIQDVRSRAIMVRRTAGNRETAGMSCRHEAEYWKRLGESCERLVEEVRTAGVAFDLIADPPSNTGYHRPYLTALQQAFPQAAYCYCVKDKKLEAGTGEIGFAALNDGTQFRRRDDDDLSGMRSILIVDDVFSNGLTSSVVVHKLRPHVHPDARFTVACPLRLPAKNEADELQQMLDAMRTDP